MFFFQWGIFASDPDPTGHHLDCPDPDALDLDEIVEDMLLEEEAEAWRVSGPGDR